MRATMNVHRQPAGIDMTLRGCVEPRPVEKLRFHRWPARPRGCRRMNRMRQIDDAVFHTQETLSGSGTLMRRPV
jgi:hypothetical protein